MFSGARPLEGDERLHPGDLDEREDEGLWNSIGILPMGGGPPRFAGVNGVFTRKGNGSLAPPHHKRLADRGWEGVWHQGHLSQMDALFTADFVRHDPGRELQGI